MSTFIDYLTWVAFPTFIVLLTFLTGISLIELSKTKKQLGEISRTLYVLIKRQDTLECDVSTIKDLSVHHSTILDSLSTSTRTLMKEVSDSRNEKIWPTPQLAELIGATINEQLTTEIALTRKMIIPIPADNSVEKITNIVCATYPHVSEDYIVRRIIATVENMSQQKS